MDYTIYNPVRIIGGEDCVVKNAARFSELGRRALIVTGRSSAKKSGALDDVTAALGQAGVSYELFDEMSANPLVSVCAKAGARARDMGAEYIIAIGGGSVIDGARAACVYAKNEFERDTDIYKKEFTEALPLVAIGTTAGTGSEVDNISVLTKDADGQKKSVNGDMLFAKIAFCDPKYTRSMDLRQTASTAMDALCHCLESWFSRVCNEPVYSAATRGAELIYPWLERIANGGFEADNMTMRTELYNGSLWGGVAIAKAGTGFPHPMGYLMTENGGVPHGAACMLFEKEFLTHSLENCDARWRGRLMGIVGSEQKLFDTIDKLTRNDISVSEQFVSQMIQRLDNNANAKKALGSFDNLAAGEIVRRDFLRDGQTELIKGGWTFGK